MAATIVQSQGFEDATAENPSATFTLPQATVAGNGLIVLVAATTKTRTVSGIVDSAGNTWVEIDGGGGSGEGYCDAWWSPGAASITSFHVSYSGTTKTDLAFYEVSGLAGTVNAHHTTPHTTASTTATDSVTTTGAGDTLIIAGMGAVNPATAVSGAVTTLDGGAGGAGLSVSAGHAEVTGAGTYSVTFTSASQTSRTTIVALDVAGGSEVDGTATGATSFAASASGAVEKDGSATGATTFTGAATGAAE